MSAHVVPVRVYFGVFLALLVFTAATVSAAFVNLGPLNNVVALSIAVVKALLVILVFMGLRWATRLTPVVVIAGFFWLAILIVLTLQDYVTRGWLGVPGK